MKLCLLALALLVHRSSASFVIATEVINCSQAHAIQPFVASIDLQGHVKNRYQLNSSKPVISAVFGNVVGEGDDILLQGSDLPTNWPAGERQVLLRLDQRSSMLAGRDTVTIQLRGNATPEQALWAREHSGGNELSAVWLEDVGNHQLMLNHRTLTSWTGEPQVQLDEWALLVDSTTYPYGGKLIYNSSEIQPGSEPLPAFYFGDERAVDTMRGFLYVQAHLDGRTADAIVASSSGGAKLGQSTGATHGEDILVWDVSGQAELRRIPMHGIALHALHFDPVTDRLCALIIEPALSNNTEFGLVEVDTATGALHLLHNFSVPSPLTIPGKGTSRAFDSSAGTLALLLVEPTDSTDWSGGDPKTAWVIDLQTRSAKDKVTVGAPHKVEVLSAASECSSLETETRLYSPTLSYVMEPAQPTYVV